MKKIIWTTVLALGLASVISAQDVKSEKKKSRKKNKEAEAVQGEKKKDEDKYADLTKKCKAYQGYYTIYRDTTTGKSYLEISSDQMDKAFLYFNHITDAPVEVGYFRGSYGGSKVLKFHRVFDRIEIIQDNTNFYYDPSTELSKSAGANINDPVLASEKIEATSKDKSKVLIDADAVFLSEKFQLIKFPNSPGSPPGPLGSLSASKTRIESVKSYPKNTDVVVAYVYENSSPNMSSDAIEDPRNITVHYQHSLLPLPEDNFKPRYDDPRIGYFTTQVNDMTSYEAAPWRDMIHRWKLEKKDATAAISEPVEPIVYWIENTTPKEFRPIIKEACERWNIAFEKAGFRNAVVCKVQPDDADWDAGDIRYNVLRWTSSPNPPFGGYGPSFVDPRTGQILGADVMLELVAIINRVNAQKIFKSAALMTDEMFESVFHHGEKDHNQCMAGMLSNMQYSYALTAGKANDMSEAMQKEVAKQLLYRLILHEVGHTLGLTHNMHASTLHSPADLKNPQLLEREGVCGSVMEYPAFNYQENEKEQGLFCDVKPGPYDLWVIEYGYSPAAEDNFKEKQRLDLIASRSAEPRLAYGNDADDMRTSGHGIDPDVNIYDLSNDPVKYGAERCDFDQRLLPKLKDKLINNNESYEDLLQAYYIVTSDYGTHIRVMTRQIGGVHYDRAFSGQAGAKKPLEPVSLEKQKEAMSALSKYAFAPDAFNSFVTTGNYLLEKRRGFSHYSESEDPKFHDRILTMQKECLSHLLHPAVLRRITDSKAYGNQYGLDMMMTDLTNGIFMADSKTTVNTVRQNLQVEYVTRLLGLLDPKKDVDYVSESMAVYELKRIDSLMATGVSPDTLTKAHRDRLRWMIKQGLENK